MTTFDDQTTMARQARSGMGIYHGNSDQSVPITFSPQNLVVSGKVPIFADK